MKERNDVPIKGKTYNFYDDEKITETRLYRCTITDVIPSDKINKRIKDEMKHITERYYWIYADKTDYYVLGNVEGDTIETQLFTRTKNGRWFSVGIEYYGNDGQFKIKDDISVGGLLDVINEFKTE